MLGFLLLHLLPVIVVAIVSVAVARLLPARSVIQFLTRNGALAAAQAPYLFISSFSPPLSFLYIAGVK